MTGYEKIAILLTEIGSEASEKVLNALNLSSKDLNRIRQHVLALGFYNPGDMVQVARENYVLQAVRNFGIARGIYPNITLKESGCVKTSSIEGLKKQVPQNPEDVASVLRNWLDN